MRALARRSMTGCGGRRRRAGELPSLARRGRLVQQVGQQVLPPLGLAGGAVAAGLGGRGDLVVAGVRYALDLAREDAELGRVALVGGGVDRQDAGLDLLEAR